MPALPGIETAVAVPIDSIQPWPGNPRLHDTAVIQDSLRTHGQFRPVYVQLSSRRIVMGHGTVEGAQALGWTEVAVSFLDIDDDEAERILLVDNRSQDRAGYDDEALAAMVANLAGSDRGLIGTGYDAADLAALLGEQRRIPEFPDHPYRIRDDRPPLTEVGDLWIVGPHRLACGDATDQATVERLLSGAPVALMCADPPYGVAVDHSWRDSAGINHPLSAGRPETVTGDGELRSWADAYRLAGAAVFVVWHSGLYAGAVLEDLTAAGYQMMQQIIWDKGDAPILGRSYYHWNHEPAWFGKRRNVGKVPWYVGRDQISVWRSRPPNTIFGGSGEEKTDHPTQKPVAIYDRPVTNHTREGEVVYDPFVGSGTALVSCARLGRVGIAMDLEPRWVDVSLRRLLAHTEDPSVMRQRPDGSGELMGREEVLARVAAEADAMAEDTVPEVTNILG